MRHLRHLRRFAGGAMLLPFLALCLLSPSAMLGRDSSGTLTMVLCTGDGPVEIAIAPGTGTPQTKQRCDWATAHSSVLENAPFALPTGTLAFHRAAPALATADWHPAYDPRNLWARGPPALA
jgi:hypothetical protein